MENIKMETYAGDEFSRVFQRAKTHAQKLHEFRPEGEEVSPNVEFEFNGITVIVARDSDLDLIWRDYTNAHRLEWVVVGPHPDPEYSEEIKQQLAKIEEEREHKREEQKLENDRKEALQKEEFAKKTEGVVIELKDEGAWNEFVENNKDPYGGACVEFARNWALLMQAEMAAGKKLEDIADETSHTADISGITGFMYGAAVNMLSMCWAHGEELRKWHNKKYKHEGDGVVNPAVMSIGTKPE